jgi:hypothetical protein
VGRQSDECEMTVRNGGGPADRHRGAVAQNGCFRLPLHLGQYGAATHRSGWPWVVKHLRNFHRPGGVLLDDFIERSFQGPAPRQTWLEPWVGIFHHPPDLPEWLDPTAPIQTIMSTAEFRASEPHLIGAIALSHYLARWLRAVLRCPVLVCKHPTANPDLTFLIERWEAQEQRRIIQVGWYARNHRAIYQVDVPAGFRKIHLLQDPFWVAQAIKRTDRFSPYRNRSWAGEVTLINEVSNSQYDYLMASSVVLNQYWDVSASNTVVEAIARCTPVLVNRLPALVEYLGADYPLFFDELRDVRAILKDPARVRLAWKYLVEMDKSWLSGVNFAKDVLSFVHDVSSSRAESTFPPSY